MSLLLRAIIYGTKADLAAIKGATGIQINK
jgi:hypothetical protein